MASRYQSVVYRFTGMLPNGTFGEFYLTDDSFVGHVKNGGSLHMYDESLLVPRTVMRPEQIHCRSGLNDESVLTYFNKFPTVEDGTDDDIPPLQPGKSFVVEVACSSHIVLTYGWEECDRNGSGLPEFAERFGPVVWPSMN